MFRFVLCEQSISHHLSDGVFNTDDRLSKPQTMTHEVSHILYLFDLRRAGNYPSASERHQMSFKSAFSIHSTTILF